MTAKYVSIDELNQNPESYSHTWIQSSAELESRIYYKDHKFILDLKGKVKLAVWEAPPSWIKGYSKTSDYLLDIFDPKTEEYRVLRTNLFQLGAKVFFEGYLIYNNNVAWVNIEKVLIVQPNVKIGPREIIGILSCPRKYYLDYIKNVGGNIIKWPNKDISRGNLIHSILEQTIADGLIGEICTKTISERIKCIEELVDSYVNTDFRMDAALHLLADTPLEDVRKDVCYKLNEAFSDSEYADFFAGKKICLEREVNGISGFTGVMDFTVDDAPVELKTSTFVSEDHIWQVKVYIFLHYLETGKRTGYLAYTTQNNLPDEETKRRIHEITLSDEDIDKILYARNYALLQRNTTLFPDTLNKDCEGCRHRYNPDCKSKSEPACEYYCQTERYWDCYTIESDGSISSSCALYDTCPVKDRYYDIKQLDQYNKLRKAVNAENSEYNSLFELLKSLSDEELRICGQKITNLSIGKKDAKVVQFISVTPLPCLDMRVGDKVLIGDEVNHVYSGYLKEIMIDSLSVEFMGHPNEEFFNNGTKYEILKDYSESSKLRSLLKIIDHMQRSKVQRLAPPVSSEQRKPQKERVIKRYTVDDLVYDFRRKNLVALQRPDQYNNAKYCAEIIERLPSEVNTLLICNDGAEIQKFVTSYKKRTEVFIIDRDRDFEPGAHSNAISERNTPADIAEKISSSSVFVTRKDFIKSSSFFENLHIDSTSTSFKYIIVLNAEEYFEPELYYLRSLGYQTLLIGDAFKARQPVKSLDARTLGLAQNTFLELVMYDSYFESNQYSIFEAKLPSLPPSILALGDKGPIKLNADERRGTVAFYNVSGEDSCGKRLSYTKTYSAEFTSDRLKLKLDSYISLSRLTEILEILGGYPPIMIEHTPGSRMLVDDVSFTLEQYIATPDDSSGLHQRDIIIELPSNFSESLEELMYSNPAEAEKVVDIVTSFTEEEREKCAVVSPYVSQISLIRSLLFEKGIKDIDVLLPQDVAGKEIDIGIISFVCNNEEGILRYPLTTTETIYSILTCSRDKLILVGARDTLFQNRILKKVITSPETIQY